MTIRNITLLSAALTLVLAGCGGAGDSKDGKDAKSKTAKKDAKDPKAKKDDKKADAKKPDEKKADDAKAPDAAEGGEDAPPDDKAADASELTDEKVVEVAKTAKEIEAKPAEADAILQAHGMDREQFEIAMATIAKDQWKSDLYIAAFAEPAKG
jgi:hypothetical protein